MNLAELKIKLIQKIIAIDDLDVLLKIETILNQSIISSEVNEPTSAYQKKEEVHEFNDWQTQKIERALQQFENGDCISDGEAQSEIQAWLED